MIRSSVSVLVRRGGAAATTVAVVAAFAIAIAICVNGVAGCAQLEREQPPQIITKGPHALVMGSTITLVASTINGTDAAYDFASTNAAVATVGADGVVQPVTPGEAAITITGKSSRATAAHAIVVIAPDDKTQIPYFDKWLTSGHADATSVPFTNWNAKGSVPVECARCHSSEGFVDYVGGDGSAPGTVEQAAPVQSVVRCQTCHNAAADALTAVTFPSGVTVSGLGGEARCMTCHQGRASGTDVDAAITAAGVTNDDEVSAALHFQNIHYFPAAATLFAGIAKGGYQYAGQTYDVRFRHVDGMDTCIGCHDPHSTKVRFDQCAGCHAGVTDVSTAHAIRMMSSVDRDYDGDGNTTEGVYDELVGLREKVLLAITKYGSERQTPICYAVSSYPYWFADLDGNGTCDAAESIAANAFQGWTARLLRATYNFQMASKDPGAFAHNAKYVIQLLYDSVADVNRALLPSSVLATGAAKTVRTDIGHFNGASEAARHWDVGEQVDASCSACHGGQAGFRFFTQYGVGQVVPETANGLECQTCHDRVVDPVTVVNVASVKFPSGVVRNEPGHDNICETCHRGRESKATVDAQIATGKFKFLNIHYLPAGATKLGSAVHVGYEYEGKTYAGPLAHQGGTQCTSCHDPASSHHTFQIADAWDARCQTCHADANRDPQKIRLIHLDDTDGDGNTAEPLAAEIDGLAAKLMAAMQGAAALCYDGGSYPYFFKDTNADKQCNAVEVTATNAFAAFTPALMKAAFNYQFSRKEPGAWAHNFDYMAQLLYDSIVDVSGNLADVSKLVRPPMGPRPAL